MPSTRKRRRVIDPILRKRENPTRGETSSVREMKGRPLKPNRIDEAIRRHGALFLTELIQTAIAGLRAAPRRS